MNDTDTTPLAADGRDDGERMKGCPGAEPYPINTRFHLPTQPLSDPKTDCYPPAESDYKTHERVPTVNADSARGLTYRFSRSLVQDHGWQRNIGLSFRPPKRIFARDKEKKKVQPQAH